MSDVLLDTNILIRYFRRVPGYKELLHQARQMGWVYISVTTRFEIVRGMRDHERELTFNLLDTFESLPVDVEIANRAGEVIRFWRAKGVTLGDMDALIAATALQHNLPLVTTNPRHFPMPELTVYQSDDAGKMTLCPRRRNCLS
jgi:predicted nucleic acid-binding protein